MRVIIFSNKKTSDFECFSSLKPLFEKYPHVNRKKHSIYAYVTRQKKPYENNDFKVQRLEVQ